MLAPNKHSHPDITVIYIAAVILKRLKKKRFEKYQHLLEHVEKEIPRGITLFLPALNFLFLMGAINYYPKNDSIEYLRA